MASFELEKATFAMLYRVAGFSAGLLATQASAFTLPSTHRSIASATATAIASAPPRHSLLKLVAEPQVTATDDAPPGLQCDEDGCVLSEEEEGGVMMNGVSVTADKLRSMELSDVNGNVVPVSSMIGESGSAVIVFLRHLG